MRAQASIVPMRSGLLGSNVSGDGLQRLEELLMQWGEGRQQEKGSHEDWGRRWRGRVTTPAAQPLIPAPLPGAVAPSRIKSLPTQRCL